MTRQFGKLRSAIQSARQVWAFVVTLRRNRKEAWAAKWLCIFALLASPVKLPWRPRRLHEWRRADCVAQRNPPPTAFRCQPFAMVGLVRRSRCAA
jgi:hypothetical protein